MEEAVRFIQELGFPIFVAVYLMFRYEKKLERLYDEHKRTNVVLAVLVKILGDGNHASVPQEVVDEVSGVATIPPPLSKENKER